MRDVVVRQRAIEWILMRDESDWDITASRTWIRIIGSAVIRRPIEVPRTPIVGHRIVPSRFFANPKYSRDNIQFPRIARRHGMRACWHENLWLHLEQRLLPELHRIFGKIRRRRVRRRGLFVGFR